MLIKALGGQGGSTHLTPIIYRPIIGFTDSTSEVRFQNSLPAPMCHITGAGGTNDHHRVGCVTSCILLRYHVQSRRRCAYLLEDVREGEQDYCVLT